MDVKIGLRTYLVEECDNVKYRANLFERMKQQYPDQVTDDDLSNNGITKLRWMKLRDSSTTINTMGFRIDGVAGSRVTKETWGLHKIRTREEVFGVLQSFFKIASDDDGQSPGDDTPYELSAKLVAKMREIREAFRESQFVRNHECIGSSLLLVADAFGNTGVFWIDFGKTRLLPNDCQISHDQVWEEESHEDGIFIGIDNLLESLEVVATRSRLEASEEPSRMLNALVERTQPPEVTVEQAVKPTAGKCSVCLCS
jgi:1D-myo-inositol-triphosphate 3-kinase